MLHLTLGTYTIRISEDASGKDGLFRGNARLIDAFGVEDREYLLLYIAIARNNQQPLLVVTQRYHPGPDVGFHPGVLLVPETHTLFIGAGERLLAYRLDEPVRLWEDETWTGFLAWERHGQFVLMLGELELAAWDIHGKKLWTTFVEPPWSVSVKGETVHLDVMGKQSIFPLQSGPENYINHK